MSDDFESPKQVSKRSSLTTAERLAYIESDVHYIKRDVASIKGLVKWIGLAVLGVVIAALTRFIISGGLNIPSNL